MISKKMEELGKHSSVIRELFEYGNKRRAEIGRENVYDFSLGNPSIPSPEIVKETMLNLLNEKDPVSLHGYTSAQGDLSVRNTIANNYAKRYGVALSGNDLYMTCGAAASLTITFKALTVEQGDEFITFAPFFPEYNVFAGIGGGKLVVLPSDEKMQPNFEVLKTAITPKTRGLLINSPNNPSGTVYGAEIIEKLAKILKQKSQEYGEKIYLISDEPYRELVYDQETIVPSPMAYYDDAIVCYSYSKSLSLPGERIGYIAISPKAKEHDAVYAAVCGAGRALGFVCAPALFQRVAAECDGLTAELSVYKKNRDLLYNGLTECGFTCVYPDGAFYLFMKSPEEDAAAFCERARKYELLFVNGADFGAKGWVRIAYCVQTDLIERALPLFKELAKEYNMQ